MKIGKFQLFENLTEKQRYPNSIAEKFLCWRLIRHPVPSKNLPFQKNHRWSFMCHKLWLIIYESSKQVHEIVPCPSWLPLHLATNLFQHAIQNKVLILIFECDFNPFLMDSFLKMILWFRLHMKFSHINFVKSFIKGWRFWNWKISCISVPFGPVWLFAWHRVTLSILILRT